MKIGTILVAVFCLITGCSTESGKGIESVKVNMPFQFSHDFHTRKVGSMECHEKFCTTKECIAKITMNDVMSGKYCGRCHDGKKAFNFSECNKCHSAAGFEKELSYDAKNIGPAVFSHKYHAAAFSCNTCHPKQFNLKKSGSKMTMTGIREGKFCGSCHSAETASQGGQCNKCHKKQANAGGNI